MTPEELRRLSRPELLERAAALGIPRPKTLTTGELVDEIVTRTAPPGTARRGWLGKARDLVANVVERGLHLPEAARVLRATQRRAPAPPPPLPTVTLAEIYAAQGYFGKAVTVLNEVLRREPEHEEATSLRTRFAGRMGEAERTELGVDESGVELAAPVDPSGDTDAPATDTKAQTAAPDTAQSAAEASTTAGPTDAVVIEAEAPAAAVKPKPPGDRPSSSGAPPAVDAEATTEKAVHGSSVPADDADVAADTEKTVAASPAKTASPAKAGTRSPAKPLEASPREEPEDAAGEAPRSAPSSPGASVVEVQAEAELDPREAVPPTAPTGSVPKADPENHEADDDVVYDIDDVVGLAVDSHTVYAYWEVRPTTFARTRWSEPDARLVLRVLVAGGALAAHGGREVETRDVVIDELVGDTFIRGLPGAAEVRLCVGMLSEAGFTPIAIAPELSTPRALSDGPAAAPPVLPAAIAQTFSPGPADATSPDAAALAVQQWAMFSRSRSGQLTAVDFGRAASGPQAVLVRRTFHSEVVRGGASDLIRRDVAADEWAMRWGPGGASDVGRGRASDLSRGHASDLSRRPLS